MMDLNDIISIIILCFILYRSLNPVNTASFQQRREWRTFGPTKVVVPDNATSTLRVEFFRKRTEPVATTTYAELKAYIAKEKEYLKLKPQYHNNENQEDETTKDNTNKINESSLLSNDEKVRNSLQTNKTVTELLSKIKNETTTVSKPSQENKNVTFEEIHIDQFNTNNAVKTPTKEDTKGTDKKNSTENSQTETNKAIKTQMQQNNHKDSNRNEEIAHGRQKAIETENSSFNDSSNNEIEKNKNNVSPIVDNTLTIIANSSILQSNVEKMSSNSFTTNTTSKNETTISEKKNQANHKNEQNIKNDKYAINHSNTNDFNKNNERDNSTSTTEKGRQWSPTLERIKHFLGIKM